MRRALPLLLLLAPLPALAQGLSTGPDCGGDAYSSATIGTNPPGPLVAVPDTLCADLEQGRAPSTRIDVIAPGLAPPPPYGDPYGDRYAPAPYDGRPLLGPRPPRGRDPVR
ncbi:hypothetical protein [Methylobacterium aquaticum]|uniref:hypothetical protein n=1 Tax=Methylobacterium aquaticum TaxID=270351 RepID=UPI00193217C1|nr:hypothetical protein [Methylobacterium aquaticum]QRE76580.1 hypothetical protein F1D61_26100 [Methylobacterium aquaticum]